MRTGYKSYFQLFFLLLLGRLELARKNFSYFTNASDGDSVINFQVDPDKLLEGIPQEATKV